MYKNLMYICFQNESSEPRNDKKMKNSQLYKGSLNTIIMKLLEENGKMYGYEITQK
jgi:DNA-binding PadR family transcriptional regulator